MITQFNKEYRWLSNFYQCQIELRGVVFPSLEAAYQASKSKDYSLDGIFCRLTPGQAKKLGSQLQLRDGWEEDKLELMEDLLRLKFADPMLKERLLNTGDEELYEGNAWGDKFWGCDWKTLEGENHLGKLLMKLRNEYRQQKPRPSLEDILRESGHDDSGIHESEVSEP